ncbi:hypothetical protein ARMGADRAFT_1022992 [Armillaria gallica]|uniref:Uncharacterized protein n=1 Tax=Armillaria gallica TaxID=47427 RepID=A0A2H3F250_ARMGA|nr:hypothetical protein ARMGADRAFT_1022992 [Armillaria gallica]
MSPTMKSISLRMKLDLVHMGQDEGKLCEGAANDAIFAICNAVKDLSIACKNDRDNRCSQDTHTRPDVINEDDQNFWQIDAKDIHQKNTFIKWSVDDSYHSDGKLWWLKMVDLSQSDADDVITQGNKRKKDDEGEGWVWSWKGKRGTWCEADINAWALKEADMDQWQEQWECQQAQFLNFIHGLKKMCDIWDHVSKTCMRGPGYIAMARKMAVMYSLMLKNAKTTLMLAGYQLLLDLDPGTLLADYMAANHQDPELAWE